MVVSARGGSACRSALSSRPKSQALNEWLRHNSPSSRERRDGCLPALADPESAEGEAGEP